MEELENNELALYRYEDLLRLLDNLQKSEGEIEVQLFNIRRQIKGIESVLSQSKNRDETFGVYLPKRFFDIPVTNTVKGGSKKVFNWKSVALEIINSSESLMTTEMVYERARVLYPLELTKRIEAIRNFSSALYYLNSSGKILRFKEVGAKEYIYGQIKLFDVIKGQPKKEYMEKFKNERS